MLVVLALRTYANAIENENLESIPLLKTLEKILDVLVFNTKAKKKELEGKSIEEVLKRLEK